MNRRVLLGTLVTGTLAGVGLANEHPGRRALSYLQLTVCVKPGELAYRIEEFGEDGKSQGVLHCNEERGLARYLSRTFKDPAAAKQLRLEATTGSTLEQILAAIKACRTAGFAHLRYFGCIPPGCSIRAGASPHQTRYEGTTLELEKLQKVLELHSTYC